MQKRPFFTFLKNVMVGKFLLYKNVVYQIQISELLTTEYNLVVSTYMDLRVSSIDIISQPIPGRRLTFRHKAIIPTKKLVFRSALVHFVLFLADCHYFLRMANELNQKFCR